jgi:hypothetical protein
MRGKQLIAPLPDTVDRAVLEAGRPDLKVVSAVASASTTSTSTRARAGCGRTNTPDVLTESTADLT